MSIAILAREVQRQMLVEFLRKLRRKVYSIPLLQEDHCFCGYIIGESVPIGMAEIPRKPAEVPSIPHVRLAVPSKSRYYGMHWTPLTLPEFLPCSATSPSSETKS